jgi:non-lysosomal glucosylceramidase
MSIEPFRIPQPAWKHAFDEPLKEVRQPSRRLSIRTLFKMLPLILRLAQNSRKRKKGGFDPMNLFTPDPPGPYQGVPLGGFGGGSIGRGWRGEFRRWTLRSGYVHQAPAWANQFSVYVEREGSQENRAAQVLFPGEPDNGTLQSWNWNLPAEGNTYHAFFPRAWTEYAQPLPDIRLTCRQLSPVIAHNYRESSFPVSEFRWQIENMGTQTLTVGLMFTWQNGPGWENDSQGGHSNKPFGFDSPAGPIRGVLLSNAYRQAEASETKPPEERHVFEDPLSFAIAARAVGDGELSYCTRFRSDSSGAEVWQDFSADGRLDNSEDARHSEKGETIGAALAVTVSIPPGGMREVAFSVAWDMPIARSGLGTPYLRRYTQFYGKKGDAAAQMALDALVNADHWENLVTGWQQKIQASQETPDWFQCALFNELYYLVDGGTVWAYPLESCPPDTEMGHFAYLEGHEYRMYNTYDVHFYASWALIQLWPRLELALQRDIAAATLEQSPDTFTEMYSGKKVPRKIRGAVPHDLGWPDEDPWIKPNGYFVHDVNQWKDLNPKFILQIYRDYILTNDRQFVMDTWEAVEEAIQRVRGFDLDGDGLIENSGYPDQTYDVWSVKGPSAYTGGLWLACLCAAAELAEIMGKLDKAREFRLLFEKGCESFEERLWNGRYYNYDSSRSHQHDSIMADQMAGQWYARACGLPPIHNPTRIKSALSTVFDWNVQRFYEGQMGAVNGMRPDGSIDPTSMQSQEVWAGTTYAAAAAMIQEGMPEAGFATARGIYNMTYHKTGYWFQTPEAWDAQGNYRSIAYMRPLAIWAMQWALNRGWEKTS